MNYELIPTDTFLNQLKRIEFNAKKTIEKKLILTKINPQRNKRIKGYPLFLFRIRFQEKNKEKRIIYMLKQNQIIIICILNRKNDYKDLKNYLERFL